MTAGTMTGEFLPLSPVEAGVGLTARRVGLGRTELRAPLPPGSLDAGRLSPALLAVAADSAVATAVFAHPAGSPTGVTVELRVDQLAPVAPGARHLDVSAVALGVTREFGTGRAEFRDDQGTLIAHAVGVMVGDTAGKPPPCYGDKNPPSPMDPSILRVHSEADGSARVDVVGDMLNSRGVVHGGVVMALAQLAQERCHRAPGATLRPLGLSVSYLRPAPGEDFLRFRSAYVRKGRRLWTLRTEVLRPDGVVVAVAIGTGAVSAVPAAG
ncbi:hotdog domain-containing protein [Nocardia sp. NPDC049526]|uniref:hotdog domain-containing protein n=1 Tax=Nocardia sp. NPDC049526 TaxID=3364316 RepID=UPI0037ABAE29